MKKVDAISYILLALSVVVMAIFVVYKMMNNSVTSPVGTYVTGRISGVKNLTYTIGGEKFKLLHGISSREAVPNSGIKQTIKIYGEPIYGDLNNDENKKDAALILASSTGSDTDYFVAFAIASGTSYYVPNALYLGKNTNGGTLTIKDGDALFHYNDTTPNESTTTEMQKTKVVVVHYDSRYGDIGEKVENFEGEADPSRMKLGMKKWLWLKTELKDGTEVVPNSKGEFTLTFNDDASINVSTDCNSMLGEYKTDGELLSFGELISTLMYCSDSQEQIFSDMLRDVERFGFTSRGELILEMSGGKGLILFR